MKTIMDYKEKYENALERARKECNAYAKDTTAHRVLKRIFPELAESEDERIRKEMIEFLDEVWHLGRNTNFDRWSKVDYSDWIAYLEKQEEKRSAEFSEEDEYSLAAVKTAIYDYFDDGYAEELYGWLKSLPKRFNLQPKQKWTEEDEALLDSILCSIGIADKQMHTHTFEKKKQWLETRLESIHLQPKVEWSEEDKQWLESIIKDYEDNLVKDKDHAAVIKIKIDFLKSIKDRMQSKPHWKPSEAQMEALQTVYEYLSTGTPENIKLSDMLRRLYNDLKKL